MNKAEYEKRKRRAIEHKARQLLEQSRRDGNNKTTYSQARSAAVEIAEHADKVKNR